MRKYYLHNGTEQQGPFDIEDLKAKHLTKDTPVWHDGLADWTTAHQIEELKGLFAVATPPPFSNKPTPPPLPKNEKSEQLETKQTPAPTVKPIKNSGMGRSIVIVVAVLLAIVGGLAILNSINSGGSSGTIGDDYEEQVLTVEEIERSQPTNFLTAEGDYNENFWGNKINIHGVITNAATVASYKDAVVRVTYYSKTKTKLSSNEYTIYELFPPHSTTNFELRIDNYKDVDAIGWDVIQASAN